MPTSATCTTQTVTKWHATMASFIASIDSNHIVSAGQVFFIVLMCSFSAKFLQNVWIPMYGLPQVVPNHTNCVTYDLSCTWEEAQQSPSFDKRTGCEAAC